MDDVIYRGSRGISEAIHRLAKDGKDVTEIVKIYRSISLEFLNFIAGNEIYRRLLRQAMHESGKIDLSDPKAFFAEKYRLIGDELNRRIIISKLKETRNKRLLEKNYALQMFRKHARDILLMAELHNRIVE